MKRSWSICWLLLISPWQHDSRRGHARSGCGERVTSALVRWAARGLLAGCELALPPRVITIWRTISNTQLYPDTDRVTTEKDYIHTLPDSESLEPTLYLDSESGELLHRDYPHLARFWITWTASSASIVSSSPRSSISKTQLYQDSDTGYRELQRLLQRLITAQNWFRPFWGKIFSSPS